MFLSVPREISLCRWYSMSASCNGIVNKFYSVGSPTKAAKYVFIHLSTTQINCIK